MGLKRFLFTFLLFSCSFIFSQSEKHTPWIIKSAQNLNDPFTSHELVLINSAFDSETLKRINKINALKKYVKDILRNRIQILSKKYTQDEKLPKLSSIRGLNTPFTFNKRNFNPLLYGFDFNTKKSQIYRVDGTDYIINIIPKKLADD